MGMASFRIAEEQRRQQEAEQAAPAECPMPAAETAEEAPKATTVTAKAKSTTKG
jgi:hypothetical protein